LDIADSLVLQVNRFSFYRIAAAAMAAKRR
jgi:hypothetical protein